MEADFLILADSAQVQGDKLYMLGGGWTYVWAQQFPTLHSMGIAAGIIVDWLDTNTRHGLKINLRSEDDPGKALWQVEGEFEQGRPAGIPPGIRQRVLVAFNLQLTLEREGDYLAELAVNGESLKRSHFKVMARKAATAQ